MCAYVWAIRTEARISKTCPLHALETFGKKGSVLGEERYNGGVACIDESVLSTLCGSNVIPVTPPMTAMKEEGEWREERVGQVLLLSKQGRRGKGDSLMEETMKGAIL